MSSAKWSANNIHAGIVHSRLNIRLNPKAMKNLADDKLVIIHSREEAGEMIGAADYELYKTYCELLPQEYDTEEDEDYHSYYETFEGTTYYEFGTGSW